ncbi:AfsR/SARP family transcriptional regulator [Nonomuraea phyllanthi]|nr:BTAD domain-containing putative transcriptional regulator [Nonomuraea phyllanthi]
MRFQILGPTAALGEDGEPVALGGPRVRALLTLLALHAGRVVGADSLVDGMYGTRPPEGVANALQSQVSRLRRALGRDLVEFHPAGYRLVAGPQDVDALRFELLAQEGRQALAGGDPGRASALLREALGLWQGAPLADAPHAGAAAAALEELRVAATEDRVQADLDLGGHRDLVAELRRLTASYPLRERLRAQLMRALYGSGRQAEALAVYEEARKLLDEELGIAPGAELAAAHLAVLRADPALGTPTTVLAQGPIQAPVQGEVKGTAQEPGHGPMQDSGHGPIQGPDPAPVQAPSRAPVQGAVPGATVPRAVPAAVEEPSRAPNQEPGHAPRQAASHVPSQDPGHAPRQAAGRVPGQAPGQTAGHMSGHEPDHGPGRTADHVPGHEPGYTAGQAAGHGPGDTASHTAGQVTSQGTGQGAGQRRGLRAQLTSFVGRDEEIEQVAARLRASRLVTLIGPGGAGKTRLAAEAAERAAGDVCFVPLAPVSDVGGVPLAVLAALDIRDPLVHGPERPAVAPVTRLVTALAERTLLLVLDNCEHLVAATAELADTLLAACPGLRVLVTGREALGITGESILPVAPLRLPPPDAADPLDYPAVRLFADRAAAVRPGFAVDAGNAAQVAGICRALDGLPLAIELAAARLRTLSVPDVAARLDDRFRLLARGSRTALPRHQTLHAVVAWSWDLLDEDERRLARRLSVFAGGARPEAAERVCGLPEEVLFSLAEKSLVELADGRFRMLETIRAFCVERLAESGEVEAVRDAHAAYYQDLVMRVDPLLRTGEQLEWLALLDGESDDVNAAARWAIESGGLETALRLVAYSACYWWMRGHRATSASLAAALVAAIGSRHPAGMEEEYVTCVIISGWGGSIDEELRDLLGQARGLLKWDFLPTRVAFLMMLLSMYTGPPPDFEAAYEEIQGRVAELPPWQEALTYSGAAFVLQSLGREDEAVENFHRSLATFKDLGEHWGAVLVLSGLGALYQEQRDYPRAYALADESLTIARELGAATEIAESLCRRADALQCLGEPEAARDDYALAAEQSRMNGSMETLAWAHLGMGEVALALGRRAEARALLERARDECPTDWYSTEQTRVRIDAALTELGVAVSER